MITANGQRNIVFKKFAHTYRIKKIKISSQILKCMHYCNRCTAYSFAAQSAELATSAIKHNFANSNVANVVIVVRNTDDTQTVMQSL